MKRFLSLLTILLPALLAAQTPDTVLTPPPPPAQFRETVEVRVMNLDVSVTDDKGAPITDLTKGDFRVRVGGKDVPIDYFARVEDGTIHAPDLTAVSPDRVLEEYMKGSEAYVPRFFTIYVDSGSLSPNSRNRAADALRDFVTRLGPSDVARIVLYDRSPKVMSDWTASKEALLAAMTKIEDSGVGMSRLLDERQTLQEIDRTRSRSSRDSLARSYAFREREESTAMLSGVAAELSTLAAFPGKKGFFFVSGGFDFQPGYAMYTYAMGGQTLNALSETNLSKELETLTRRANASEITFYTFDARGLNAEGISAAGDDPLSSRPSVSFIARQDSQTGMVLMARETGGVSTLNSNDLKPALANAYRDASTYYSIGVNISKLATEGYSDVRVDVTRPGVNVATRRSWAPRSADEKARDAALAALRSNVAFTGFPVKLAVAPASKGEKKLYSVPVTVTFPASSLTFVPDAGNEKAAADVWIGAIDDRGRTSEVQRQEAAFTLPANAPDDQAVQYAATLNMKKGNYRIVVNVRDKTTGKTGTGKADVRVD
jgi:VWFA-related protein